MIIFVHWGLDVRQSLLFWMFINCLLYLHIIMATYQNLSAVVMLCGGSVWNSKLKTASDLFLRLIRIDKTWFEEKYMILWCVWSMNMVCNTPSLRTFSDSPVTCDLTAIFHAHQRSYPFLQTMYCLLLLIQGRDLKQCVQF